ncbi:MAG: hypothetical protein R2744_10520 [Bacteroidales bacterium]
MGKVYYLLPVSAMVSVVLLVVSSRLLLSTENIQPFCNPAITLISLLR